jgi:ferredoxin
MKYPVVELSDCISCGVCVEICGDVFRMNDAGFVEVMELADYPESDVKDAIKYCPVDCIFWEES